jgi:hypothetical protein
MPQPGPEQKKIAAVYYARFGDWPPGLLLVLRGDPVPHDLQENASRMRRVFLAEELKREIAENLNPPKRVRVSWTNDQGEEITIEGYEARVPEAPCEHE